MLIFRYGLQAFTPLGSTVWSGDSKQAYEQSQNDHNEVSRCTGLN